MTFYKIIYQSKRPNITLYFLFNNIRDTNFDTNFIYKIYTILVSIIVIMIY